MVQIIGLTRFQRRTGTRFAGALVRGETVIPGTERRSRPALPRRHRQDGRHGRSLDRQDDGRSTVAVLHDGGADIVVLPLVVELDRAADHDVLGDVGRPDRRPSARARSAVPARLNPSARDQQRFEGEADIEAVDLEAVVRMRGLEGGCQRLRSSSTSGCAQGRL